MYLKWILNNVNYTKKIKLHLQINVTYENNSMNEYNVPDANFVHRYCMPDTFINLVDFHFYIVSKCKLLSSVSQRIINSFKNYPYFIGRNWINVKCYYDPIMLYQHVSSNTIFKPKLFCGIM